jgi:GH35 family endo-1,4-beta-xylanase
VATNDSLIKVLKTRVDAMFKTMAATGKLVRVTELDVKLGTGSPSAAQYKCQSDCYRMIFESYKENIPAHSRVVSPIWSLSDNPDEHEYWLNGDVPNLYDANYLRKWAYKGVCDGIAGEDLGLKYGGDDYKAYYEKQNVSSTVAE